MNNDVGMAVRLARVACGKTQWQLARKLGVHPVVLNHLERGTRVQDVKLADAMLKELQASTPRPRSRLVDLVMQEAERIVCEASRPAKQSN